MFDRETKEVFGTTRRDPCANLWLGVVSITSAAEALEDLEQGVLQAFHFRANESDVKRILQLT